MKHTAIKNIALVLAGTLLTLGLMAFVTSRLSNNRSGYGTLAGQVELPIPDSAAVTPRDSLTIRVDSLIQASIAEHAFPGASVAIGTSGGTALLKGYGHFTYDSNHADTPKSQFDLASLTKVVATTTAVMKLYEAGKLDLDAPVIQYLPAFSRDDRDKITVRQLLTHSAGLIPFRPYYTMGITTREEEIKAILAEPLAYPPGTKSVYSDHSMILMGLIIERITGQPLAKWETEHIFKPLGMNHTGYRPVGHTDTTVVPTEIDDYFRHRLVQGEVHDETAYVLGGVSGNAGLFSTAEDLSRFARMMLNHGRFNGTQFLKPETVKLFTTRVTELGPDVTRALGWDTPSREGYSSAGHLFGPHSFGHTGFTGTSIWIDPDAKLFVVLLTNRVYPTRENSKLGPVRAKLADLAYEAMVPAGAARTAAATVR
ncbi:MAG TPA: serine hydrolase domain-containing protein [Rhodothermales bacterium]|nr:serine hydrolase domain-containing protein [Rhodothermales bacterium]